jgi:hypothetical protein
MERAEMRKADSKSRVMREKITRDVAAKFRSEVDRGDKIGHLVAKKGFVAEVIKSVIERIEEGESAEGEDEYFKDELMLSYVRDLQNTKNKIENDLVEVYSSEYSGKFRKADKFKSRKLFSELMDDVLARVINSKSSVFLTVQYKSELLEKSMKRE